MAHTLDMVNRDPNNINNHLKAEFEDILGEPEGVRSIGCVWSLSFKCFNLCRDICYKLATLFTGICMAIHLGHVMACVAYQHVWLITPCMKICEIECVPLRKCLYICVDCCLGPICESCGLMLSKIKISKA